MKKSLLLLILFVSALSGCYYDNYRDLYPNAGAASNCDTVTVVTYGNYVSSIMTNYCVSCHSKSIPNGGVILDSYSGTVSAAQNSNLLNCMLGQDGFPQMPPTGKVDQCSISEVQLWIQSNYAQ